MLTRLSDSNVLAALERALQSVGADPSDDEETRLKKTLLLAMAATVGIFAVA